MKVVTLNNLKEFLELMKVAFGAKGLANKHRNALDTYILNVDYSELEFDTGSNNSAVLGVGRLGTMILGKL